MLKADHRLVLKTLDAIERVSDPDRRRDLFSYLRMELIVHSKAEEEAVYRPLRERIRNDSIIKDSVEDHHEIEHLLMDIQFTSSHDALWMEKIRELGDIVEEHVRREETELFDLVEANFSAQEAEDIAIHMMEEKGKLSMENPFTVMARKVKEALKRE
jgi:hemerythrin superfamily protein